MKLTSPHCLSLGLHDAQQVSEDRRENPEITAKPVLFLIKVFFCLSGPALLTSNFCFANEATYTSFETNERTFLVF